ncbi:MAG: AbrB/MazE/SpoVT family DNA-binding domain-containing protein [Nanoarchaeota archaeon]
MEVKAITRKWGNSIAIVIPREIIEKQRIKEDEEIIIKVEKKKPKAGVLWGFGKGRFKKSAQEIKDELRGGWLSKSDREREEKWRGQK